MIPCPSCGAENADGTRFCVKCGTTLSAAPSPESWRAPSGDLNQTRLSDPPPVSDPQPEVPPVGGGVGVGGYQPSDPFAAPAPVWQPGASAGHMGLMSVGERREPVQVVIFLFLTCGLYGIWWWYTVITEIKNALNRQDINPGTEIVLALVTCGLYGIYLYYKYPQLMLEMQDRAGRPRNDISMTSLLLAIFGLGIVSIAIMQSELNNIWDSAGGGRRS